RLLLWRQQLSGPARYWPSALAPGGFAWQPPAATARPSPCAARSTRAQAIVVSTSSPSTAAALSRSRTRQVPALVPAGNCLRARASVALLVLRASVANAARQD